MKRLFLLPLLVAASFSLASCRSESPAIKVNDLETSIEAFDDEITQWWASDDFREVLLGGGLSFDADASQPGPAFIEVVATRRISFLATGAELDNRGVDVTADDIAAMEEEFASDPTSQAIVDSLDADLRAQTLRDFARQEKLNELLQEPGAEPVAFDDFDVFLDPRYGTWDPDTGAVTSLSVGELRIRRPASD